MQLSQRLAQAVTLALLMVAPAAAADPYSARQYYSGWQSHPQQRYSYRHYYYKPSPSYSGYKHHYVIKTPKDPNHLYFYNPYKKQYWGRCPAAAAGQPLYSLLAEADRRERLDQIPSTAFPPPAALPPIPDSTDGAFLDLPPDDPSPIDGLPQ
jgi:hypothetical protein